MRTAWPILLLVSSATFSAQGCSDPFESCAERRACPLGGAAGTAGALTNAGAGAGGVADSSESLGGVSSSSGAGGAPEVNVNGGAGGDAFTNAGNASSSGGASGGGASGGGASGGGASGEGGMTTAYGGSLQGGAPGAGGSLNPGQCRPGEEKLCSTVFPGIARCGGKRIKCPSTGYWPPATDACVPATEVGCGLDDDNCDGTPDYTAETCACTPGEYTVCYVPGDSDCKRGVSICVQGVSGGRITACQEPPSGMLVMYPQNRTWCTNRALLGAPCLANTGVPGTMEVKCVATETSCDYLYCLR
ncbi:MAG: hypothetical protein ACOY0T_35930 [Myxococcota bacterium]